MRSFSPLFLLFSYGVLTFGLVFVVQNMGGILQVTLTLNGLLGGVTLGLFALGIFFKKANSTGAFYGTLIALISVVFVGIMSQFETVVPMELPLSVEECMCPMGNGTSYVPGELVTAEFSLFRISYMWYPFMGCMLTVLFSLLVSYLDSSIKYRNVLKINSRTTLQPTTTNTTPTEVEEPKTGIDNIAFNNKY